MKKLFLILALLFCIPVLVFSWTDTSGDTTTITSGDYDEKDIANNTYDKPIESVKVAVTSGTVTDVEGVVATSDTVTHTQLDTQLVLLSTNTAETLTELIKHYVLSSSNTAEALAELIKHYVLISSGTTGIISGIDTMQSSLSSIDTNTGNIYDQQKSSVMVSDVLYGNKLSTTTAGKSFTSGTITISAYDVSGFSFITEGGNAQITTSFMDGILYIREGIPVSEDLTIPVLKTVLFQYTLDSDTTMYWFIDGGQ